jgi:phosphate starvation-inducible PhoH-like protein
MKQKKDCSPRIPQREKIKNTFIIKQLDWTEKQKQFINLALDKNTRLIFVSGPAGSTKTILAVYSALELLNRHVMSDILYIRSAVESADSKIGYLPGEVEDKMSYYGIPFSDKLEELLNKDTIQFLKKDNRISIQPVNYIRGQSWNARVAIVDEAQNMTRKEIFTVLTRVGRFSKCFVLADPTQSDINGKSGGFSQLSKHFCDTEGAEQGVHLVEFLEQDIMRDALTRFLVRRYDDLLKSEALNNGGVKNLR